MDAWHTFCYTITTTFKSLVQVRTGSIPFLYECEFCTRSHSSTASSLLQNIFPEMATLRAQKKWKSEAARSGLHGRWERSVHLSFVTAYCVFTLVWACTVMWKGDFIKILWSQLSPETLLQGFKGLNVHIRVNGLTMWHIAYQNHPSAYQKCDHDSLLKGWL